MKIERRNQKKNQQNFRIEFETSSRSQYAKKKVRKWLEKDKKIENFDDKSTQTSKEIILDVSFAETFVEDKIS